MAGIISGIIGAAEGAVARKRSNAIIDSEFATRMRQAGTQSGFESADLRVGESRTEGTIRSAIAGSGAETSSGVGQVNLARTRAQFARDRLKLKAGQAVRRENIELDRAKQKAGLNSQFASIISSSVGQIAGGISQFATAGLG